jgi:hypothetical protein
MNASCCIEKSAAAGTAHMAVTTSVAQTQSTLTAIAASMGQA